MPAFLAWVAIWIISTVASVIVGRLLAKRGPKVSPQPYDPVVVPSGTPIPVVFGTARLTPIPFHFQSAPPREVKSKGVIIGHRYEISLGAVLCWGPVFQFANFVLDGRKWLTDFPYTTRKVASAGPSGVTYNNTTRLTGISQPGPVNLLNNYAVTFGIYLPQAYGGWSLGKNGGIDGTVNAFSGNGKPLTSTLLSTWLGSAYTPQYSDLCYFLYDKMFLGLGPAPPPLDFVVRRHPQIALSGGWGNSHLAARNIVNAQDPLNVQNSTWQMQDANPAAIVVECMLNRQWGLGMNPELIDLTNTSTARATLEGEGFGMSLALTEVESADNVVQEVLQTIDALLLKNPATQKFEMKLVRNEVISTAAFNALRSFSESSIASMTVTRNEWEDTVNEVIVEYTDVVRYFTPNTVTVRNDANVAATDGVRSRALKYRGITKEDLAIKVATRELWAHGNRLWRGTMQLQRTGWDLAPGDVFRVSYARYGFTNLVVRATRVNIGDIKKGMVEVDWVEDFFRLPEPIVTVANGSGTGSGDSPPWIPVQDYVPEIEVTTWSDAALGYLNLQVTDILNSVTAVEFATKVGGAALGAYAADTAQPYQQSVARVFGFDSEIHWRVSYTVPGLSGGGIQSGSATFPAITLPQNLVDWTFSNADGQISVTVDPGAFSLGTVTSVKGTLDGNTASASTDLSGPPWVVTPGPKFKPRETKVLDVDIIYTYFDVGTTATQTATWSFAYSPQWAGQPLLFDNGTSGGTVAIDWANGVNQKHTLDNNTTYTFANPIAGELYTLESVSTGAFTVTYPSVTWQGGAAAQLTSGSGNKLIVDLFYNGSTYYGTVRYKS